MRSTRRILRSTPAGLLLVAALAAVAGAERPPAEAYQLHCSGCHGPTGDGALPVGPSLRPIGALADAPGGRDYLVRVPGVAQAPLDDDALATLLNWALREIGGRNDLAPYSAAEVGRLRRQPFRDPASMRPARPEEPTRAVVR